MRGVKGLWLTAVASGRRIIQTHGWRGILKTCLATLLVLLPVWALARLVDQHAINAPFLDDFAQIELLHKAADGHLTWHDFFVPHMEHRIAWTRLLVLTFATLFPKHCWIAQVWFNWVLLCLTLINVPIL